MIKILEQSASPQQEFDKFFTKFLAREEAEESHISYRTRCISECCGDVNAVDHNGRTLLHWGTIDGDFEAIQILVSHGADVNAKCCLGNTALHWIACLWFDMGNHLTRYLVSKGADVNAKNKRGLTPLHYAAFYARLESVKFLVSAGAKINAQNNKFKYTPLHFAVRDVDITKFLVSSGADIHARNNWGHTVLHEAACIGAIETVKILITAGADFDAKDDFGETALDVAARNRHTDVLEYLSDLNSSRVQFRNFETQNLTATIF
jgi:ankyrin repeat protein